MRTTACKNDSLYPALVVNLTGYRWECQVDIGVLMLHRTLNDLKAFVRLYLYPMDLTTDNLSVPGKVAEWLNAAIPLAKAEWEKKTREFVENWHLPDGEYARQIGRRAVAAENRQLEEAVKAAKKRYLALEKKRDVFLDECQKYNIATETSC